MDESVSTLDRMAKDRHKPTRMIRLPEILAKQLDELAKKNVTNVTQETIRAVREMLAREGLWPPPPKAPKKIENGNGGHRRPS